MSGSGRVGKAEEKDRRRWRGFGDSRSGHFKQKLQYFVGESGWWSAEGLKIGLIREEDVCVTEIVRRIKVP